MFLFNIEQDVFSRKSLTHQQCCRCHRTQLEERSALTVLQLAAISVLPLRARQEHYCRYCYQITPQSRLPLSSAGAVRLLRHTIGLLLLLWFCHSVWQDWKQEKIVEQAVLSDPIVHDHYLIDYGRFTNLVSPDNLTQQVYLVGKAVNVDKDNVVILLSNYRYTEKRHLKQAIQLDNLLIHNYFGETVITLPRERLITLRENDAIYQAVRPKNLAIFGGLVMRQEKPPVQVGYQPNINNQKAISWYQDGNFDEAFKQFLLAAEDGHAWSQYNLAQMYQDGEGTPVNLERARYWYQQASEQGISDATASLTALTTEKSLTEQDTRSYLSQ